ncbi:MAG: DUF86 domain-containing protein [Calditrichaeota bacterium]|nr:MAG: DUF86 domain-containing protein [Calditrichota bacterium]
MSLLALELLQHLMAETSYILQQTRGLQREVFLQDETLKRAFTRSLEIISEASKDLPADIKQQHSGVDWKALAAMRDKLIHLYLDVDEDILWDIVCHKVPVWHRAFEQIMQNEIDA